MYFICIYKNIQVKNDFNLHIYYEEATFGIEPKTQGYKSSILPIKTMKPFYLSL